MAVCLIKLNPDNVEAINFLKAKWKVKTNTKIFLKALEKAYLMEKV